MKRIVSLLCAAALGFSLAAPAAALEVEDAKELLRTYYIDPLPDGFEAMTDLEQIIAAINDPYTTYLSAEEYGNFQTAIEGESLVGIGVSVRTVFEDGFRILSVFPDSPARKAGLEAGDTVLAVDGYTLTAADDITAYVRGTEGSAVTLTVRKGSSGEVCDLSMVRSPVRVPNVSWETVDNALVIECDSFGSNTATLVMDALNEHADTCAVTIMDLRSNPGGTSTSAIATSGLFLGSAIMTYFRDASGEYTYYYTGLNTPDLTDKPLIVLTSPYSASGSELFSAAMRDYSAGISLGQRTLGKGVAQYLFDEEFFPELFDGDCLKITAHRFYSPNGATNDTVGILPTLMISAENTPAAALLLAEEAPSQPGRFLRLELAGHTFYIDSKKAMDEENRAAFAELLEALPPSAVLSRGSGSRWFSTTPEILARLIGLKITPRTFSDTQDSPYAREINTLACCQILSGCGDGTFRPQQEITRGEVCAMIASALDLSRSAPSVPFSDLPAGHLYADAVSALTAKKFLSGYQDGTFRPDQTITYQELVCVLDRISAWACMEGYENFHSDISFTDYVTFGNFPVWCRNAARDLDRLDALLDLSPSAPVSREQAAAALCRTMEGCGLLWN